MFKINCRDNDERAERQALFRHRSWGWSGALLMLGTLSSCGQGDAADALAQIESDLRLHPVLTAVTPALGPSAGHITLTLEGRHFAADSEVRIDNRLADDVVVYSPTLLTATLPAHLGTLGLVPVSISHRGRRAVRDDLFSYFASSLDFAAGRSFRSGEAPLSVAKADFNRDGNLDLIVANADGVNLTVFLGDGTGNFNVNGRIRVAHPPRVVATGDFNDDGKPDFVVASEDLSVFLGDGTGQFGPAATFAAGINPSALAVGDFNCDGNRDIVVTNQAGIKPKLRALWKAPTSMSLVANTRTYSGSLPDKQW